MLEPTHGRLFIAQFQTWSGYSPCRKGPERSKALDRFNGESKSDQIWIIEMERFRCMRTITKTDK